MCYTGTCNYEHLSGPHRGDCAYPLGEKPHDAECMCSKPVTGGNCGGCSWATKVSMPGSYNELYGCENPESPEYGRVLTENYYCEDGFKEE